VWCGQESKTRLVENFKAVQRQLNDEAERIKTDVELDADELRQTLTINKAHQAKNIDQVSDTVRAHLVRLQMIMTRCHVSKARFPLSELTARVNGPS